MCVEPIPRLERASPALTSRALSRPRRERRSAPLSVNLQTVSRLRQTPVRTCPPGREGLPGASRSGVPPPPRHAFEARIPPVDGPDRAGREREPTCLAVRPLADDLPEPPAAPSRGSAHGAGPVDAISGAPASSRASSSAAGYAPTIKATRPADRHDPAFAARSAINGPVTRTSPNSPNDAAGPRDPARGPAQGHDRRVPVSRGNQA